MLRAVLENDRRVKQTRCRRSGMGGSHVREEGASGLNRQFFRGRRGRGARRSGGVFTQDAWVRTGAWKNSAGSTERGDRWALSAMGPGDGGAGRPVAERSRCCDYAYNTIEPASLRGRGVLVFGTGAETLTLGGMTPGRVGQMHGSILPFAIVSTRKATRAPMVAR